MIILNNQVKIYLPSTKNINQPLSQEEVMLMVKDITGQLSELFGGATVFDAVGAWRTASGEVVLENIKICQCFLDKEVLQANLQTLTSICLKLKRDYTQEAISLEINGELTFI